MHLSSEKVRLGLIGLGTIGVPHLGTLSKLDTCELIAIADVDEKPKADG